MASTIGAMPYGAIPAVGDHLSRLVLGTLTLTPEAMDLATAMIERYLAIGGNVLDTAFSYGHGQSETVIGAWIQRRGRRDDLFIVSKGAHPTPEEPRRVTPEAIMADMTVSLERLGGPIDLYLLHRDDPEKPVGPIVDCLNEQLAAGRIRAFGASNWSTERIDEANAYAAARGLQGFVASSVNLALAVTNEPMWPGCISVAGDADALTWYRERGMPLLSWSAQASGFFSGRFSPDNAGQRTPFEQAVERTYFRPDNWERLRRVREVAARHGCTPMQLSLAWVLRHPLRPFALIGPLTLPELEDSLGALAVDLTPDEHRWLNLEE